MGVDFLRDLWAVADARPMYKVARVA